jgi:hypothetical protein
VCVWVGGWVGGSTLILFRRSDNTYTHTQRVGSQGYHAHRGGEAACERHRVTPLPRTKLASPPTSRQRQSNSGVSKKTTIPAKCNRLGTVSVECPSCTCELVATTIESPS